MTKEEPPVPSPPSSPSTKRQTVSFLNARPVMGTCDDYVPHEHFSTILAHTLNYEGYDSWVQRKLIERGGKKMAKIRCSNGFNAVERMMFMDDVYWPNLACAMRAMDMSELFKSLPCVGNQI